MNGLIQTENLCKQFRSTPALNDITLAVPEGAIYALVGANGAGKTTLIKLLMNIFRPTSGGAQVMGIECRHLAGRDLQRIGYVSENQEMPDWMTSQCFAARLKAVPFVQNLSSTCKARSETALRPNGGLLPVRHRRDVRQSFSDIVHSRALYLSARAPRSKARGETMGRPNCGYATV
jgi:ABC-type Mn2+/Zn2+ transport system ATPase subunit